MELYDQTSLQINQLITSNYSSSFGLSSTLFSRTIRPHIYSIYGFVRIADEIVDTYRGDDAARLLAELHNDINRCIETCYSANPVVHAFGLTVRAYGIDTKLIDAFIKSMRMDLSPFKNTKTNYESYIYGSAEVVGLMCLYVFINGDKQKYIKLESGARALGAAYQKINFLRDLATDASDLKRWYFPNSSFATFDERAKQRITDDIRNDIATATLALSKLPRSSKKAVALSLRYYSRLLERLEKSSPETLKKNRLRVPTIEKLALYTHARMVK